MKTITEIDLTLTTMNDNRGPQEFMSRVLGERDGFTYHLDTYLRELLHSHEVDIIDFSIREVVGDERFNLVFQYREGPPSNRENDSDNLTNLRFTLARTIWDIIESSRILGFKEEIKHHDEGNWWAGPKANSYKGDQ